ncbi:Uncharacterised protein [Serratia liquefaciens]|jgi:hypothetical protein|nr:Uncharacterised protein [Serratia liquefaciens]
MPFIVAEGREQGDGNNSVIGQEGIWGVYVYSPEKPNQAEREPGERDARRRCPVASAVYRHLILLGL